MMKKSRYPARIVSNVSLLMFHLLFLTVTSFAQGLYVRGHVSSPEGDGLASVNIFIQGTTNGTITDLDGNYSCYIPGPESVLVFSSVGFKTRSIQVNNQEVIDIVMEIDVTTLKEVIVTGYTSEELRKVTGAISKLDPREIQTIPVSSVEEQLTGRIPGVFVISSGKPGGDIRVRIRGFTTINDNNPLYIVDGIPVEYDQIRYLNTFDIESIQVLKDAASASIYGARASNGVIIITTTQGNNSGKNHFTFNGYTGVQVLPKKRFPVMLSPQQHVEMVRMRQMNEGFLPEHPQYNLTSETDTLWGLPDYVYPAGYSIELNDSLLDESTYIREKNPITRANKEGTDWIDEISQPALVHNYNLGMSGGDQKALYALSLGFYNQDGIIIHTGYEKYMSRINSIINFNDRFRMGEFLGLTYEKTNNSPATDFAGGSTFWAATQIPTIMPVYDIAGNYTGTKIEGFSPDGMYSNPVAQLTREKDNVRERISLLGSFFLEYDVLKNMGSDLLNTLTLKTSFNPALVLTMEDKFFTPTYYENKDGGNNSLSQASNNNYNWTWYNTATYNRLFNGGHKLGLLAGMEAIRNKTTSFSASRTKYAYEDINFRHLSTGEENQSNYGISSRWSMFSAFGKIDYDFRGKYIVSGTARYDGSSRFGENNRFAFFPAVSAGWRVSDESFFMGNIAFIDNLMLRASWGQTGNQNIGDYRIYNAFTIDPVWASYPIKGEINKSYAGLVNSIIGNPNMQWESTTTIDAGLDLSMFSGSLDFTFDWYDRKTTGMLIEVTMPDIFGTAHPPFENIGDMRNTGFEFSLLYTQPVKNDFTWSAGLNFSHYKNKVLKLNSPDQKIVGRVDVFNYSYTMEDYPISSFYGLDQVGLFQSVEEAANSPAQAINSPDNFYNEIIGDSMAIIELAPGRMKFRDANGDDVINEDDYVFIGSPHPDFYFGIPVNLKFKGWELSVFCYGSYGNEINNLNKYTTDLFLWDIGTTDLYSAWGMPGVDNAKATIPKPGWDRAYEEIWLNNSYFVEDASFLRIQQVILGYNFSPKSLKNRGSFRIYVQANNILTLTRYSGIDPNFGNEYRDDTNMGWEFGQYPAATSYMAGVNIIF